MSTLVREPQAAARAVSDQELEARPARLDVESFGLTDPGRVRPSNEDHFLIADLAKNLRVLHSSLRQPAVQEGEDLGHLLVVADGMGGHSAGEHASSLTVLALEHFLLNTLNWFFAFRGPDGDNLALAFQEAVGNAQDLLFHTAARCPDWRGMGTTLTLAYVFGNDLFVAHVGDSRCYLVRGGNLRRLTHDHTIVEEMIRRGMLKPAEGAHHPYRHVITNCVGGTEPCLRVETTRVELEPDDVLLLCSDGLTEMVPDERIREVLLEEADLEEACARLVAAANENGGRDNVTVVVARFREGVDVELVPEEDENDRG